MHSYQNVLRKKEKKQGLPALFGMIFLSNKYFDQKLPDALALADFSMFGLTIHLLYQSRD